MAGVSGVHLKEGTFINKSLTTLGVVIAKLAKGTELHIPYRESKLTRLLSMSLGAADDVDIRSRVGLCCGWAVSRLRYASQVSSVRGVFLPLGVRVWALSRSSGALVLQW